MRKICDSELTPKVAYHNLRDFLAVYNNWVVSRVNAAKHQL